MIRALWIDMAWSFFDCIGFCPKKQDLHNGAANIDLSVYNHDLGE
jgi:hypothetical protein